MENQRIQKLVKLAYIADIHGDYKIADKIFEKLAATPPPRQVIFRRTPAEVLRFIEELGGQISKIKPYFDELTGLIKKYESHKFDYFLEADPQNLAAQYREFLDAKKNLPTFEADYQRKETFPDTNIMKIEAKKKLDDAKRIIEQGEGFFGDLTVPPLTEQQARLKLAKLKAELDKIAPEDTAILPKNNPERLFIEKMKAYFKLLGLNAKEVERRTLKPFVEEVGTQTKVDRKDNPKKGTSSETRSEQPIKKLNIFSTIFNIGALNANFVRKQLFRYNEKTAAMDDVLQPSVYEETKQFIDKIRGSNKGEVLIQPLRERLRETVLRYNTLFFNKFNEAVAELTAQRLKEIQDAKYNKGLAAVLNTPTPFDIKSDADLLKAVTRAQELVAKSPDGLLIRTLFETIESEIKNEISKAKDKLKLEGRPDGDDNVLQKIKTANRGFFKNIGITDDATALSIIEKEGELSFDEFIELSTKDSKRLSSANWEIVRLIVAPATQIGLGVLAIFLRDSPIQWGVKGYKYVADVVTGKARKDEQEKQDKIINQPQPQSTQSEMARIRNEMKSIGDRNRRYDRP